ncbi:MAG: hypothetical protein IJZ74_10155, partial [Clostridia bacterium]|nr:hypothetical protein [Clostridia bacterium]
AGVAVHRHKSDTPSGPLCFFLRIEKEEAALTPTFKRKVNKQYRLAPQILKLFLWICIFFHAGLICSLADVLLLLSQS